MWLKTKEDFQNLKFGQKIYTFTGGRSDPKDYRYAGFSPVGNGEGGYNYVMLVCGDSVSKMITLYVPHLDRYAKGCGWTDSYEECKLNMLKSMIKELQSVKDCYFDDWSESDWRDFNLNQVLGND